MNYKVTRIGLLNFWYFDDDYNGFHSLHDLSNACLITSEDEAQGIINGFELKNCKPVKIEIKESGKKKRIETMVDLFAHLITRNNDRPFNEVWEMYFGNMNLEHKNMEEVEQWLNEEVEE